MSDIHTQKYLKYKAEYLQLKHEIQLGGANKFFDSVEALEYSEWIKHAEKNKLFFGPKDYAKIESNKNCYIVQIDYIKFLFIEWAKKFNIKENKIYEPLTFFNSFKSEIITKSECKEFKKGKGCNYYDITLNTKYDKTFSNTKTMEFSFYLTGKDQLTSGSGDGYSRWMSWENLAKMPQFYFKKSVK